MIDAVIFDWGGTLTPWRTVDFDACWRAVASRLADCGQIPHADVASIGAALLSAEDELSRRSREEHRSGVLAEVFAAAGVECTDQAYAAVYAWWEHATYLDPDCPRLFADLKQRGIAVGVLSNTCWQRSHHESIFARDGVLDLIDGAVYSCEIPWTKPHPEAFRAAIDAVGAVEPSRCVYVGDRPFEDIHGAKQAGMRAVLMPHSEIPARQRGHTEGEPDAVIARLAELTGVVDGWISQA
ncbi:MAG: HAD family hydrolase [Micromonosporaceae bacterium]